MNMKFVTIIALTLGCLAVVGIANMTDDSDAATVDPSTGTQVGDLYYNLNGTWSTATVVGISSALSSATSITIPDTVTSGDKTYNVTSIADSVFSSMTTLETVTFSQNLTSIESSAFNGCTSLALTSLPSGLTRIGNQAFNGCTSLALTSLPSGLTNIGLYAFQNCSNLALTSLPDGMTTIKNSAFNGCTSLALTSLPSGLTSIGSSAFQNCTNLALTSLPSGLTSIGGGTFSGCTSLALTSLPSGLTSIGTYAFYDCIGLVDTLVIPESVETVGVYAFSGCTGYTSVVVEGSPTFGTNSLSMANVSEVLNLGDTVIAAGDYGLPNDVIVLDHIPLLGYVAPTSLSATTQKEGAAYDLMKIIPVIIILAVLVMAATAVVKRD